MPRLRGTVESKGNGIVVNTDGWDAGIEVHAFTNPKTTHDEFVVTLTGGRSGGCARRIIAHVFDDGLGKNGGPYVTHKKN